MLVQKLILIITWSSFLQCTTCYPFLLHFHSP